MKIPAPAHKGMKRTMMELHKIRAPWFTHWREVADYFLPRRYPYLATKKESSTAAISRNRKLLNSTTTLAVRTLASGMMNGVTSPARPWFRLRIPGFDENNTSQDVKIYLTEVERIMMLILAESNFYNSMAILYLEWCTFGTAAMAIYEDFNDIIRCYNYALGEFYISQGHDGRVNRLMRKVSMTLEQIVKKFGEDNVTEQMLRDYKAGDDKRLHTHVVVHLIEENDPTDRVLKTNAKFREVYWLEAANDGNVLSVYPLYEWNLVVPRWELHSGDAYGTSPAMDALGDAIELQFAQLDLAKARKKALDPALIVDQQLRNRPTALHTGGITYASAMNSNFGAKKAYDMDFPFQEERAHIETLQSRIRETCHNNLFNMISNLETVRSATEIDARREEKLVHLGPVLERFENEGLDPSLKRVFAIAQRKGIFPDPPESLDGRSIEVQYVSVLSDAQRAVGTVPIERFFALVGQVSAAFPSAQRVPNVEELIRQYAEGIGIKPKGLNSPEEVAEAVAADEENQRLAQSAAVSKDLAGAAQAAGNVDVGGGQNAVSALLG
jgi:hypothetical protein